MKRIFVFSLILNVLLLAGVIFYFSGAAHRKEPAALASAVPVTKADAPAPAAAVATPPPAGPVFAWSQLGAKDYHVYVKNLRGIGCPEPTVRAIVTADVHAAYRVRYGTLEKKLSELENSPDIVQAGAFNAETALKTELQGLPDVEAAEIADLLGLKPAAAPLTAAISRRVSVTVPLALQNVDLSGLNLTEAQQEAIANVRQQFLEQIGGANQDPNDPAYLARWQKAQPDADATLGEFLGNQAYSQYQAAAYQMTLAKQAAP